MRGHNIGGICRKCGKTMRNFQFLSAHYNKGDKSISLYCTDGLKTYKLKVIGFDPYFFVPEDSEIPQIAEIIGAESGFQHEEGFKLKKIVVSNPSVVHSKFLSVRDMFSAHYEADIKFIRRFLIDTGIKSGFTILSDNLARPIHYTELKPSDFSVPLKLAYVDFEFESQTRFPSPAKPDAPITAWTIYNSATGEYTTAVLSDTDKIEDWSHEETIQIDSLDKNKIVVIQIKHFVVYCSNEYRLLNLYRQMLDDIQPHLIVYWYGNIADDEYPRARALSLGIKLPYHHSDRFDLCFGYQNLHGRLYTFLKGVAVDEGLFKFSELVAEKYHKDMRSKNLKQFISYNFLDVRIMVMLDQIGWWMDEVDEETKQLTGIKVFHKPLNVCQFFWDLKQFVGVEDAMTAMKNSVSVDILHLRKAHSLHKVLNSGMEEREKTKSPEGAIVFDPVEGILPTNPDEVIAVLDMSKYYPNIFLGYNIDEIGNAVIRELIALRTAFEKQRNQFDISFTEYKMWDDKVNKVKFILNTVWAYYLCEWVRKYDKSKSEKVLGKARLGLITVKDAIEGKTPESLAKLKEYVDEKLISGFQLIAGDTDSLILVCQQHLIAKIVWYLNEVVLKEHCEKEGIPPLLKLAHEKTADKGIFVKNKNSNRAAKKRRALHLIWSKGHDIDEIEIKGFDYVRGNCTSITRKMQMRIIVEILKGDKNSLPLYIRNITKDIRAKKYSIEDLSLPINISKPLSQYGLINPKTGHKGATPDFVQGARWSNTNLGLEITAGDRINYLYCLRPTSVIAFFDSETLPNNVIPDYEVIIEKAIKQKSLQFLRLANITWSDVVGHSNFSDYFNKQKT
jgi:DNA polymerase I